METESPLARKAFWLGEAGSKADPLAADVRE